MSGLWLLPFTLLLHAQPLPPAAAPATAGLRYLPPGVTTIAQPPRAGGSSQQAELIEHPNGEIELHFDGGYRMELRATVTGAGTLALTCRDPGHPSTPHVHAEPAR